MLVVVFALACSSNNEDPEAPTWKPEVVSAEDIGSRRGLTPIRVIVHLHSPYSHDACDGEPRGDNEDGPIDEDCLSDLRAGLCNARIDVAALTDHDGSFADEEWGPHLFLFREGDELIRSDVGIVGNWIQCDDGPRTMIRVGSENNIMPIFMERHPEGDAHKRHQTYNGTDILAADDLRAAGAKLWVAHSEKHDIDWLREIGVDGMEIYNIHAAIAPDIREQWLGLPGVTAAADALEFNVPTDPMPEPDLGGLPLMFENEPALSKWTTLLSEGRRVSVTAGTDAHQNSLPIEMSDGERVDSYRRMLRMASNIALVADPSDPVAIEAAITDGQSFVSFELVGSPQGFDTYLRNGTAIHELGAQVPADSANTLVATTPTVVGLGQDAGELVPEITTVIVRVDESGTTELASGNGEVRADASLPGAYRTEVRIKPRHLEPHLGTLTHYASQSFLWVRTNSIYVR